MSAQAENPPNMYEEKIFELYMYIPRNETARPRSSSYIHVSMSDFRSFLGIHKSDLVRSAPSESWAENTMTTECMRESGHLQSVYSLVCSLWSPFLFKDMHRAYLVRHGSIIYMSCFSLV